MEIDLSAHDRTESPTADSFRVLIDPVDQRNVESQHLRLFQIEQQKSPLRRAPMFYFQGCFGGATRNRTEVHGFAGRCITTLPSRRNPDFRAIKLKGGKQCFPPKSGAAEESRTLDLNLGKVALYQLSYCRAEQSRHYRRHKDIVNIWFLFIFTSFCNFRPGHAQVVAH